MRQQRYIPNPRASKSNVRKVYVRLAYTDNAGNMCVEQLNNFELGEYHLPEMKIVHPSLICANPSFFEDASHPRDHKTVYECTAWDEPNRYGNENCFCRIERIAISAEQVDLFNEAQERSRWHGLLEKEVEALMVQAAHEAGLPGKVIGTGTYENSFPSIDWAFCVRHECQSKQEFMLKMLEKAFGLAEELKHMPSVVGSSRQCRQHKQAWHIGYATCYVVPGTPREEIAAWFRSNGIEGEPLQGVMQYEHRDDDGTHGGHYDD